MESGARYRGGTSRLRDADYQLPSHSYSSGSRSSARKSSAEKPPWRLLVAVFVFIGVVFGFVRWQDHNLPTPLTIVDIASNPHSFIEERARSDLKMLTSNGPRPCGSHTNDVLAVDAIIRLLEDIKRAKYSSHSMEIDVQKPSGSFHMLFQDGMTSSYANIPNIVVKLSPASEMKRTNVSFLVNCHFDTVPGSPGASDNMISCANMIEILRVLTRTLEPLRNDIIFLFNGAEENILQGSHGFVAGRTENDLKGHPWSKNVKAFINLEAAGAGGREILFQTGPGNGWLLDAYAQVPHPYGSVVGEEIFQKQFIPSDTDFRIFRDFAHIPGLDMAFIKNGYAYHTKLDNIDAVTPGSIQHEGSNVLALIQYLGNLDFSSVKDNDQKMVFFDVYGLFLVYYSERTAMFLNLAVALITLAIAWKEANEEPWVLLWYCFSTFGAWISGIVASVLVGVAFNILGVYSPFHSYPGSVFLIFGIPCMMGQVISFSYTLRGKEENAWIATKATLAICVLLGTFLSRVVFVLTLNLIFGIVGWYTARKLFSGANNRCIFYLFAGEFIPITVTLYLVAGCIDVFVPIMGRAGSEANPNIFVAVLTSFTMSVPAFTGIVPIFLFFKKMFLRVCAVSMLLVGVGLVIFVGKVPYTEMTPMRLHIVDVDKIFYDTDMTTVKKHEFGYWLFNVDPNIKSLEATFAETISEMRKIEDIDVEGCQELNCGLPFYLPVKKLIQRSQWIPKTEGLSQDITGRIRMQVTKDEFISPSVRRISLSFTGPTHMSLVISPTEGNQIIKWSLTTGKPQPSGTLWQNRPVYFVYRARGIEPENFEVTIDFERGSEALSQKVLANMVFSSFHIFGDEMKSTSMKHFIRKFPSWTYTLGWSAVSHNYQIPA